MACLLDACLLLLSLIRAEVAATRLGGHCPAELSACLHLLPRQLEAPFGGKRNMQSDNEHEGCRQQAQGGAGEQRRCHIWPNSNAINTYAICRGIVAGETRLSLRSPSASSSFLFFFFSHSPLPGSFVAVCAVAISVFVCVKAAARISPNSTFNTCKFLGQQRQHLWRPPPHFSLSLSCLPPFCILFLFAGRGNRVLLRWARMVTCRDSCFNLL